MEAASTRDLANGLKSIGARFARAVNRVFQRAGPVLADRAHVHVLRAPREVRNAIAYVLCNARRHAAKLGQRLLGLPRSPCRRQPTARSRHVRGAATAAGSGARGGGVRQASDHRPDDAGSMRAGYDKYAEITSEHMIRSTFCDLAVKVGGELSFLIEVKAIGLDLKEAFIKQAVDYAANQGVDWVVLTNGVGWRVFKVNFTKPIEHELVVDLDLLSLSARNREHIELIGLLAKEGWQKARLGDYHSQRQAMSRFALGALLLSDPVLDVLRRQVRRLSPEVKVDAEQLKAVLQAEVLKREVLEGEKADLARRQVARASNRPLRATRTKDAGSATSGRETESAAEAIAAGGEQP